MKKQSYLAKIFTVLLLISSSFGVADSGWIYHSTEYTCVNRSTCPYNEATRETHYHTYMKDKPHTEEPYEGEHTFKSYSYSTYYCTCD